MTALDRPRRAAQVLTLSMSAVLLAACASAGPSAVPAATAPASPSSQPSVPAPSRSPVLSTPPSPLSPLPSPTDQVYVVQENDTLSGIAQRFGVTVAQLLDANPQIANPDVVRIGDRILVPAAIQAVAVSDAARVHATRTDAAALAGAIDRFGLGLYRVLAAGGSGNLVFSPVSVEIALSMARAGARGETAAQMDAVLGADWPTQMAGIDAIDQELGAIDLVVKDEAAVPHEVVVGMANAPFAQRGFVLQPAYLDALAGTFGAGVRLVDYAGDADGALQAINGWVADRTAGRIAALLQPVDVTSATRLVLVDAMYLKAPWAHPWFAPSQTAPAPFTRPDGSTVAVPLMQTSDTLPYAKGPGWQATQLGYLGTSLALTIIVPDDLAAFEARRDPTQLQIVAGQLDLPSSARPVRLFLPTFSIGTRTSLKAALGSLGMPLAFDRAAADFSGMALGPCAETQSCFYVGDVIHQATISVDEKGTEAAAATAVEMRAGAAPVGQQVTIRADRPFLFLLRDTTSGAILFMGRVTDPSKG